jgi:Crp-like helix-turn-helix domain
MTRDRAHADELYITHEFLAYILSVRRASVTRPENSLRKRKLIRYRRGKLVILDGRGLEGAACGCYAAVNETHARVVSSHGWLELPAGIDTDAWCCPVRQLRD